MTPLSTWPLAFFLKSAKVSAINGAKVDHIIRNAVSAVVVKLLPKEFVSKATWLLGNMYTESTLQPLQTLISCPPPNNTVSIMV